MSSYSVSSLPTPNFETVIGSAPTTSSPETRVKVVHLQTEPAPPALAEGYSRHSDRIKKLEADPRKAKALAAARAEISEETRKIEGHSLRTRRLELGLSQIMLAELIGSSQSHIARIERGTENLQIQTCRRLCAALKVDMNALDLLLQAQENVARQRGR